LAGAADSQGNPGMSTSDTLRFYAATHEGVFVQYGLSAADLQAINRDNALPLFPRLKS
jgi:hypothetical protein